MSNEPACGHSDEEHEDLHDLFHMVQHVQRMPDPRVALIVTESGEVHFASSIAPGEAADLLLMMADRVKRYGGNYVRDHFDRGAASRWN